MSVKYEIELEQQGREYPHYWEMCVGSCHAATILREDVREHIRKAHNECGFKYLRFHGLFDDDMSVVTRQMFFGDITYSFYNIDCIIDFLLDTGMKPFLELGFMPELLASGTTTCFHYKGNITLPKDWEEWQKFIRAFGEHLLERYGKEEVSSWYFEVWNEPNLNFFFDGSQEDYFKLYKSTAEALKSVNPCLKVGGPGTSSNAWITDFREFCESGNVPLDFITTHHYPSDDPLADFGTKDNSEAAFRMPCKEEIEAMDPEVRKGIAKQLTAQRVNKNPRDVLYQMTKKARKEAGNYPLIYTEWNGAQEYDTSYQAAAVIHTLAYNENLVEGYSFWTVSDIFEEMGLIARPFADAFGLLNKHGIPKPVYHIFSVLHEAGDKRLEVVGSHETAEVFALTDGKRVIVMAYNHDIVRRNIKTEEISLILKGSIESIRKAVIDEFHCNPKQTWADMESPEYLTKEQLEVINQAAQLVYEDLEVNMSEEQVVAFLAEPESVTILDIVLRNCQ